MILPKAVICSNVFILIVITLITRNKASDENSYDDGQALYLSSENLDSSPYELEISLPNKIDGELEEEIKEKIDWYDISQESINNVESGAFKEEKVIFGRSSKRVPRQTGANHYPLYPQIPKPPLYNQNNGYNLPYYQPSYKPIVTNTQVNNYQYNNPAQPQTQWNNPYAATNPSYFVTNNRTLNNFDNSKLFNSSSNRPPRLSYPSASTFKPAAQFNNYDRNNTNNHYGSPGFNMFSNNSYNSPRPNVLPQSRFSSTPNLENPNYPFQNRPHQSNTSYPSYYSTPRSNMSFNFPTGNYAHLNPTPRSTFSGYNTGPPGQQRRQYQTTPRNFHTNPYQYANLTGQNNMNSYQPTVNLKGSYPNNTNSSNLYPPYPSYLNNSWSNNIYPASPVFGNQKPGPYGTYNPNTLTNSTSFQRNTSYPFGQNVGNTYPTPQNTHYNPNVYSSVSTYQPIPMNQPYNSQIGQGNQNFFYPTKPNQTSNYDPKQVSSYSLSYPMH